MEEETVYRVWISDGSEVGTPGVFTVFGAVETAETVDGTFAASAKYPLDTDDEHVVESSLARVIEGIQETLGRHAGVALEWVRSPIHDAGLGGWNVCEARL